MVVRVLALAGIVSLAGAAGCGSDGRVPVFPVAGTVSFNGEAPVGAQVVLHAVVHPSPHDVAPTGVVREDGSFKITSYELDDGAPLGEYVATIQWFKIIEEAGAGARGPNVLPVEYASPETSPIRLTVTREGGTIPPISIVGRFAAR
jgi:hypothetical protein